MHTNSATRKRKENKDLLMRGKKNQKRNPKAIAWGMHTIVRNSVDSECTQASQLGAGQYQYKYRTQIPKKPRPDPVDTDSIKSGTTAQD